MIEDQTMRRLILFTGWSGVVSTTAPTAGLAAGFETPLATVVVGVAPALAAPGALVAAGFVPAGTSLAGGLGAGVAEAGGVSPVGEGFGDA